MKLSTLQLVASFGNAASGRAHCTIGVVPSAPTIWKTTLPWLISWAACGDDVTSAVASYSMNWWS